MKRAETLAVASGFFAVLIFPGLAPAQSGQGLGVVSTISGQATISRISLSQPIPLQFKDSVFDRDRIATAENSTVKVLMGGKALVTVRELSVLTITEEMKCRLPRRSAEGRRGSRPMSTCFMEPRT